MKLKLDLHPIFNDTQRIEAELARVIDEAIAKRATEVEIIPGKGSGALKKSVIRFLDRPDIKSRYHRIEKDSDNWGRLFVHFRHDRTESVRPKEPAKPAVTFSCACCAQSNTVPESAVDAATSAGSSTIVECDACGTPNRVNVWTDRKDVVHCKSELGYE